MGETKPTNTTGGAPSCGYIGFKCVYMFWWDFTGMANHDLMQQKWYLTNYQHGMNGW